uniref:Uncharacterized protein n=1 Tax=Chromera velia CCMP2878 TaxID=1169474 RepID=A0A0G4G185_9ALVE|eukprot:Cvel_19666.t1-p1 / transcript=Cvel_19666.t1 / gene=Cvel_19666 / organism=Chromera_velia_CCMP2878 / gene_product=hypothetical protein / transcript_product=hypothetical protein / location=Cvel_scaffold1714:15527-18955(+) / protein_length=374 / sequence_SO=supercontig / SO=protein_coding / is_pseudo=false
MPLQSWGLGNEVVFSCPAVLGIWFGTHDPSGAPKNIVVPCSLHTVDQPNLPDVLICNARGAGLFIPRLATKDVLPAYRAWAKRTKEERQISHGYDIFWQPWFQSLQEDWDRRNKVRQLRQQVDPYERIPKHPLPEEEKKRSAKKDFRAISDGIEVPVAAYPITYWVVGRWTATELADTDYCQQGPFLSVRKFDNGGAAHFKPWDYGYERTHLTAFSVVRVDQKREAMALHTRYGHQNFDDLKETLSAEGTEIDEDCRRFTLNICRRFRTTSVSGKAFGSIRKELSSWLRRAENRRTLDCGGLLLSRRGEQGSTTAGGQGEVISGIGDSLSSFQERLLWVDMRGCREEHSGRQGNFRSSWLMRGKESWACGKPLD